MKCQNIFFWLRSLLLWTGVLEAQTYQVPVSEKNEKMQEGRVRTYLGIIAEL